MIHHRPQGLDHPLFQRSSLIRSAAVGSDMVLSLRLPLGSGNTGLTESYTRNASIRIDGDGEVFLTLPHLRTRQDIYTSIFMLIAERLKVLSATHAVCLCSMNCQTELRNTVGRADTRREARFHTT